MIPLSSFLVGDESLGAIGIGPSIGLSWIQLRELKQGAAQLVRNVLNTPILCQSSGATATWLFFSLRVVISQDANIV